MTVGKIEEELVKATGIKPKAKETRLVYLGRLVKAVSEMSEEDWAELSEDGAQKWYNTAVEQVEGGKDIPEIEGSTSDAPVADDKKADKKADKKTPAPAADKKVGDKKGDDKKKPADKKTPAATDKKKPAEKKAAAEKKPAEPKGPRKLNEDGVKVVIKKALIKNPKLSVEELVAHLKEQKCAGSLSTVRGIRAEFRHTLQVMESVDRLHEKLVGKI